MCEHVNFEAQVDVNRIVDVGRFAADVRVKCADCGTSFRFLGLPGGLNINGAAVSVDGTEARLAIAPIGEEVKPITGSTGFSHPVLTGVGDVYPFAEAGDRYPNPTTGEMLQG